jgi:hypothetical protein
MLPRLCRWMLSLSLLHVGHNLLHGLRHMSLHDQHLLKHWWRRVGIVVVLIGTIVVSVDHLMIVERVEIQIEIKDSQLYASSYNDD